MVLFGKNETLTIVELRDACQRELDELTVADAADLEEAAKEDRRAAEAEEGAKAAQTPDDAFEQAERARRHRAAAEHFRNRVALRASEIDAKLVELARAEEAFQDEQLERAQRDLAAARRELYRQPSIKAAKRCRSAREKRDALLAGRGDRPLPDGLVPEPATPEDIAILVEELSTPGRDLLAEAQEAERQAAQSVERRRAGRLAWLIQKRELLFVDEHVRGEDPELVQEARAIFQQRKMEALERRAAAAAARGA